MRWPLVWRRIANADVAVLVRDRYRNHPLPEPLGGLSDRLVVVYADLRDFHDTRRAVRAVRPDLVFHLAAGGISDPFLDVSVALEHNLFSTLNLLRAAFEDELEPAAQSSSSLCARPAS